ncbi:hypothetical protein Fot_34474 [Forsythia ovata]|uniref:Uncharacterized protein n=1 Tax=Forsythia ovata TaxID=205694 RepID=A0ABD1SJI3_9LAMI
MSSFHFSKVPKFKIRRGGIVDDVSTLHLASSAVPDSRPTVLQGPETVVGNPHVLPAPEVRADIPSPSSPARHGSSPENVSPSVKKKSKVESENKRPGRLSLPLLAGVSISTLGPAKTSWIRQS